MFTLGAAMPTKSMPPVGHTVLPRTRIILLDCTSISSVILINGSSLNLKA